MSKLDDKLEDLYAQQEIIGKEILIVRKRLLPIKLRRLLKTAQQSSPGEQFGFVGFLKSALETPDKVSTVGIYPIDRLFKFCQLNDIPLTYDNVGDEYRGDSYANFRVGFRE